MGLCQHLENLRMVSERTAQINMTRLGNKSHSEKGKGKTDRFNFKLTLEYAADLNFLIPPAGLRSSML